MIILLLIAVSVYLIIEFCSYENNRDSEFVKGSKFVSTSYYGQCMSLEEIIMIIEKNEDGSVFDKAAWFCVKELSRRENREQEINEFISNLDGFSV